MFEEENYINNKSKRIKWTPREAIEMPGTSRHFTFIPSSHEIQRSPLVKKQATACLARWCIQPSSRSWVMIASIHGNPVWPWHEKKKKILLWPLKSLKSCVAIFFFSNTKVYEKSTLIQDDIFFMNYFKDFFTWSRWEKMHYSRCPRKIVTEWSPLAWMMQFSSVIMYRIHSRSPTLRAPRHSCPTVSARKLGYPACGRN